MARTQERKRLVKLRTQHTAAHSNARAQESEGQAIIRESIDALVTIEPPSTEVYMTKNDITYKKRPKLLRDKQDRYEVATIGRLLQNIGLFCKRAL